MATARYRSAHSSKRYLGRPREIAVEMRLGAYAFIRQGNYVEQWADNFVRTLMYGCVKLIRVATP